MSESDRPLDEDGFLLAHEPAEEGRPDDRIDDERMDEENTFKPEFVRAVEDALEEGDTKAVYELVEPLHPADIADLLELLERQERYQLAAAITDLMTSEVVAELNDYVREDMMEALPPEAVAQIVDQLFDHRQPLVPEGGVRGIEAEGRQKLLVMLRTTRTSCGLTMRPYATVCKAPVRVTQP